MIPVEHVAWQVKDPTAVAQWYAQHLGFHVLRKQDKPPFTHFIADAAGRVVIELYNRPEIPVPDYAKMNPLQLHLAFQAEDLDAERDRLVKAGATVAEERSTNAAGDWLIMLRDPFGFPIQLCKRVHRMLG